MGVHSTNNVADVGEVLSEHHIRAICVHESNHVVWSQIGEGELQRDVTVQRVFKARYIALEDPDGLLELREGQLGLRRCREVVSVVRTGLV